MNMLKLALALLLAAPSAFAEGLPAFDLDRVSVKDLLGNTPNAEILEGARDYDLRGAPEPVCGRADGLPLPPGLPLKAAEAAAQAWRTYDGPDEYPLPGRAGYVQINSSTRLKFSREKGELAVTFPDVDFVGGGLGDRADLFVKMTGTPEEPAISWATVICSGGSYLGYKGANVGLPAKSGSFSIGETLAMGAPKALIARTHRWLTAGMIALEDLCSEDFRERMKDARAGSLPEKLGPYAFDYNASRGTLKVKWETK